MSRKGLTGIVCLLLYVSQQAVGQVPFTDRSSFARVDNNGSNHGISFGDFNNDDLEDIYIAVREFGIPNKLYLNTGNGQFVEMAADAGVDDRGVSTAAVWGDIDNDGHIDLYVGNTGSENRLYINNGDLTFTDITGKAEVGDLFDPRSVQFADVDNDGFLDIYVHNYNTENVLYINNQDLTFTNSTETSKAKNIDPAMGTLFFDIDGDGDQDLFALNDGANNVLFLNNGDGTFEDFSEASGLGFYCSCMGVDFGDYDADGDYDLYVSNYGDNFLMENNGDGTFTDKAKLFEVNDKGVGWGTFWFDYDNDGDQDLYLANHEFIIGKPNVLYRNDDAQALINISSETDLESPFASFGAASADVNNDGQVDILVANWGTTAVNQLFVNEYEDNHSVLLKAKGTTSNASAIGTTVTIRTGDKVQVDQITGATGYASQNSLVLHFGLGLYEQIDELTVKWPSGLEETYVNLEVDKYYRAVEGGGIEQKELALPQLLSASFEPVEAIAAYPNPFTKRTFISLGDQQAEGAYVEIYTLSGTRVALLTKLSNDGKAWGFSWDGKNTEGQLLSQGVYFYNVRDQHGIGTGSGRLILSK